MSAISIDEFLETNSEIDVVTIETGGSWCFNYNLERGEELEVALSTDGRRVLRFWPLTHTRDGEHPCDVSVICRYSQAVESGDIDPRNVPLETFTQPDVRLVEGELRDRTPMLIYDDAIDSYSTCRSVLGDFLKMGLDEKRIWYLSIVNAQRDFGVLPASSIPR